MEKASHHQSQKPKDEKENLGLTVKKGEDFSEWYSQIVIKSELADYSPVSGCIIYRPLSYGIWENIQAIVNEKIKASGHKNCYFPLFIPENLLTKEAKHVEGFSPEVAWVTHAGNTPLNERLAVRPTSETIMYDAFAQWIRSWRDLPLLLNQWNSVVRWEFKHAKPLLRGREFLWQEGHTAHATKEDADKEVMHILHEYIDIIENYLAIALIPGKKTEREKFAGADYTTTMESLMPDGRALQMGTSHMLGQNFAKAFNITFKDQDEAQKHVWQTSWAISTRTIGAMVMMHGDDNGLIIPPKVAPTQIIIVPIIFKDSKEAVVGKAQEIKERLIKEGMRVEIDARDEHSAGFKFNHWELRGTPLRIELGPKDLAKGHVVMAKRNSGEKKFVMDADIESISKILLDDIQNELLSSSKKRLEENLVGVRSKEELKAAVSEKKLAKMQFCLRSECEEDIKNSCDGATSRCLPFDEQKNTEGNCAACAEPSKGVAIFGKNY